MIRKIKIIATLLILLFLLVFCVYHFETSWKIYTNEQYGFQLSIPRTFKVEDIKNVFYIKSPDGVEYLHIIIDPKPDDYKEPVGPFPLTTKSVWASSTITPDYLNGIPGFRGESDVEGGGGSFETFTFTSGRNIWSIIHDGYPYSGTSVDESIYLKIRNSFKLK